MMQEINKDILNYYKDNYDLAIAYYQNKTRILFEEEYILQFYQICKDAKRLFLKFKLDIKNLIPVISNITFLDCRVGNGMVKVLYEIAKYKAKNNKVIIFTFDGNSDFYLASFISQESSIDYKEVLSFINPLYYKKTNKDNINKIIKSILKIQNISIYLNNHSLFDDIIKCKDYDVIIIDSLDYLLRQTNYSLNKTLKILNSLNKELIIFERPKNKYKVYDDITIKDIKYYTIKKKYAENFYSFKKNNKIVIKNMFGGDNYEI